MPEDGDSPGPEEQPEPEVFDEDSIVMHCALRGDIDRLRSVLDTNDDPHHESALEKLNSRNSIGKSPMEMACMLGKDEIVQELIKRGVDPNATSAAGYTPLHVASCWGSRACLEILFENGGKLNVRNNHGETPKSSAVRYKKEECVEFLDWAEAEETVEREKRMAAVKKKK